MKPAPPSAPKIVADLFFFRKNNPTHIIMAKETLTATDAKAMLHLVADRIIENEPYLSEADRNLGDGDHGLGMQRGFTAAKEKLNALTGEEPIDKVFSTVGMALISSMGGASGAIFGTLFRDGGKALAGREALDAAGLAVFFRAACDGVVARGKAQPGDKTMVDSLHPAAVAAEASAGLSLIAAAEAIAAAAAQGRDASKAMIATLGRAKTLGEASIGHPDAGACSVTLICEAMRDAIAAG
jgi:phosphoenolpyruvate---glycerone phosphotransferase subunit DhaL